MVRTILQLCFVQIILVIGLQAQEFTGQWKGYITLEGQTDTFLYEVNLTGNHSSLNGSSFCFTKDTSAFARFNLVGVFQDGELVIQEVEQTEPKEGKWCHKYLKMNLSNEENTLMGTWTASNCDPGGVFLERDFIIEKEVSIKEKPFEFEGKWIGHLIQSDRTYGFYLELNLNKNSFGTSFIESEGVGGNAKMNMQWQADVEREYFLFKELGIMEKSIKDWKWCLKNGKLNLSRTNNKYILEGIWNGYIEGFTAQTGACAPGSLILEKAVLTEQLIKTVKRESKKYTDTNQRKIKVQRVIEVKSKELKLRTWDSGDVDGDIITIFLNGRQLLVKFRVSKRRYAFPVSLEEDNNFLVLHADDIGDISPNTVAISIDDGVKEQMIVLSSDLEESGAILIKQVKIE